MKLSYINFLKIIIFYCLNLKKKFNGNFLLPENFFFKIYFYLKVQEIK